MDICCVSRMRRCKVATDKVRKTVGWCRRIKAQTGNVEVLDRRQALPPAHKLSRSPPCSATIIWREATTPAPPHWGWLGLPLAHMVPLCRRLKDALSKHPFFQDDMAPFQSTGLAERSEGCISAPTRFLCQAPLYYAQVHTQRCRPWKSPILSLNCHIRRHLLL